MMPVRQLMRLAGGGSVSNRFGRISRHSSIGCLSLSCNIPTPKLHFHCAAINYKLDAERKKKNVATFRYHKSTATTIRSFSSETRHYNQVAITRETVCVDGINFGVTIRRPNRRPTDDKLHHHVLCLPGALGTGESDFSHLLYGNIDDKTISYSGSSDGETLDSLGNEFTIYAIDPRGIGRSCTMIDDNSSEKTNNSDSSHIESSLSSSNTAPVTFERDYPSGFYHRDAMDAAAVMRKLLARESETEDGFIFSKYSVLGWSDGANTAIQLASDPATKYNVEKLVLWGGNTYVTQDDVDSWEAIRDVETTWSERMKQQKIEALFNNNDDDKDGEEDYTSKLQKLQRLNDRAIDGWIDIYRNPKTQGDVCLQAVHNVEAPTLVVHGRKDPICSIDHAMYIYKHIPNSSLVFFDDAKHNVHQRYASDFHQLVRTFLLQSTSSDEATRSDDSEDSFKVDNGIKTNTTIVVDYNSSTQKEPAIDQIAYAFMGSKALASAIKAGIFDAVYDSIQSSPLKSDMKYATFDDIYNRCEHKIPPERLRTLLNACVGLNLIHRRVERGEDRFWLPAASAQQLVSSSKGYWGDYISRQVDEQFYNRMQNLDMILRFGSTASDGYESWFEQDPESAKLYTQAQHNGSLATGYAFVKRFSTLFQSTTTERENGDDACATPFRMLDVGGGSGAFSIAVARKQPNANCVVLDLPNVTKVAEEIIDEEKESLRERISTLSLSATAPDQWTMIDDETFDMVLMSYVSGSIPADALPGLYRNAFRVLRPGGKVVVHDFFVDNGGDGPLNAALWALAHVTVNPEGMGLRPNRIVRLLADEGFVAPKVDDMIPSTTQIVVAYKPHVN